MVCAYADGCIFYHRSCGIPYRIQQDKAFPSQLPDEIFHRLHQAEFPVCIAHPSDGVLQSYRLGNARTYASRRQGTGRYLRTGIQNFGSRLDVRLLVLSTVVADVCSHDKAKAKCGRSVQDGFRADFRAGHRPYECLPILQPRNYGAYVLRAYRDKFHRAGNTYDWLRRNLHNLYFWYTTNFQRKP